MASYLNKRCAISQPSVALTMILWSSVRFLKKEGVNIVQRGVEKCHNCPIVELRSNKVFVKAFVLLSLGYMLIH